MKNKPSFFNVASRVFWGLIILIGVMSLLHLDFGLFNTENVAEEIALVDSISPNPEIDTSNTAIDTSKANQFEEYEWAWKSFDNKSYKIKFKIDKNQINNSTVNRNKTNRDNNTYIYNSLYSFDKKVLIHMIESYKFLIKKNNLDYKSALDVVITSIQSIPYTLVLSSPDKCPYVLNRKNYISSCRALPERNGCCDNVEPLAVYSPVEFATKKTGDCDTRSLFAYTILKEMGFDVAIMVSRKESHSVLGIKSTLPKKRGNDLLGKEYVLWELTNYGFRIGDWIDGNDWEVALN